MGIDQDVIDVYDQEVMEILPEHLIHKSLEYGQAIRHDPVFIVACGCYEGGLALIAPLDLNEVVHAVQDQLCEDGGTPKHLQGRWDQWKWVPVVDCLFVEGSIIYLSTHLFSQYRISSILMRCVENEIEATGTPG